MKLGIKPVVYEGRRLQEVGEAVVGVFNRFFDDFSIYPHMDENDLLAVRPSVIAPNIQRVVEDVATPFYYMPNGNLSAEAFGFNVFLTRFGKYTLGVTSIDMCDYWEMVDGSDATFPGMANPECYTAHIVNHSRFFGSLNTDENTRRMANVAVHEVGHLFGLEHHDQVTADANGKICSMVCIDSTEYFSFKQFLDDRKLGFCGNCEEQLDEALKNLSVQHR